MKKVLVAIELSTEAAQFVLTRARDVCAPEDRVEVVHVVDPASVTYSVDPTMTGQIHQQMYDTTMANARKRMVELCTPFGFGDDQLHVRYGRVAHEVHALVEEGQFDCCMVGSHGYAGWHRVLGSKASSILHGTQVDVWVFSFAGMEEN